MAKKPKAADRTRIYLSKSTLNYKLKFIHYCSENRKRCSKCLAIFHTETMKTRNTILEKKYKNNLAIKPELLQSVIQIEKGSFQTSDYVNLVYFYAFTWY